MSATINQNDVARLLRRARNLSEDKRLLQRNYRIDSPDHADLGHQRDVLEKLIAEISSEEVPWDDQIPSIEELANTVL